MEKTNTRTITYEQWLEEGKSLFGDRMGEWRFVCPACGYIAKIKDWNRLGARNSAAFTCIGRFDDRAKGEFLSNDLMPCNYAGGGLIKLNPVTIIFENGGRGDYFEFDRN